MRVTLSKVIEFREYSIGAMEMISTNMVGKSRLSGGFFLKIPVAILVHHNCTTSVFEIDGQRIDLETFDIDYPGARREFEYLLGDSL